jgi:predicted secreted protein
MNKDLIMSMTRFTPLALMVVTALSMTTSALAHEDHALAGGHPDGTVLHVAATERTQVTQDLLIASLRIEHDGTDAKAVQAHINSLMDKALAKAKGVGTVKTSTGGYHVYHYQDTPPQPRNGQMTEGTTQRWRGTQSIELQSTDSAALLTLAGALQDMGLVMSNLSYSLSPEAADVAKDSLMEKALDKVQARANRAAKALGRKETKLLEVTIDAVDSAIPPYPMMRSMAMESSMGGGMPPPSAEPGTTDITLSVQARVLLKD